MMQKLEPKTADQKTTKIGHVDRVIAYSMHNYASTGMICIIRNLQFFEKVTPVIADTALIPM